MSLAVRKIKNGKVKINGKIYAPVEHHWQYKGELDGHWYAFGLYDFPACNVEEKRFVSIWGTKESLDNLNAGGDPDKPINEPHCINGELHWLWWDEVTA
jgi:hypothetical protein